MSMRHEVEMSDESDDNVMMPVPKAGSAQQVRRWLIFQKLEQFSFALLQHCWLDARKLWKSIHSVEILLLQFADLWDPFHPMESAEDIG